VYHGVPTVCADEAPAYFTWTVACAVVESTPAIWMMESPAVAAAGTVTLTIETAPFCGEGAIAVTGAGNPPIVTVIEDDAGGVEPKMPLMPKGADWLPNPLTGIFKVAPGATGLASVSRLDDESSA